MSYKFVTGSVSFQGDVDIEGKVTAEDTVRAKDALLSGSTLAVGTANLDATEVGILDGATLTTAELNLLDDITRGSILAGTSAGSAELDAKTSGQILVGDGTDILSVAVSGDISLAANGAVTISAGAVEHSMLNENIISGQNSVGAIEQTDLLMIDDGPGEVKKATFSDFEDSIFGNVSGDATIAAGGALTIAGGAVEHSMLNENIISGQNSVSELAQTDLIMVDDGPGEVKKATFSDFEDSIFGNVSGDATIAAGGVLTIAAEAVHGSMLNDDAISGQAEMTGDVADTDELMISDAGVLKRADFSVVRDAIFNDVSGDATVAAGGALTIAANAVEGSMINSNAAGEGLDYAGSALVLKLSELSAGGDTIQSDDEFAAHNAAGNNIKYSMGDIASKLAGAGIGDASGVLSMKVSGAVKVTSDFLGITGSFAGEGLTANGDDNYASDIFLDLATIVPSLDGANLQNADVFAFSDDSEAKKDTKKVTFQNLQNSMFANVSGDATIAAGGALTIANAAVEPAMLNSSVAGVGIGGGGGDALKLDLSELSTAGVDITADAFAFIDASDSSINKKEDIAAFIGELAGSGLSQNASTKKLEISSANVKVHTDGTQALVEGINVYTSATNATLNLPSSAEQGDQIVVKARTLNAGQKLTVAKHDAHNKQIDGLDNIKLIESFSAVTLVYVNDTVGWAII